MKQHRVLAPIQTSGANHENLNIPVIDDQNIDLQTLLALSAFGKRAIRFRIRAKVNNPVAKGNRWLNSECFHLPPANASHTFAKYERSKCALTGFSLLKRIHEGFDNSICDSPTQTVYINHDSIQKQLSYYGYTPA